MYGGGWIDTTGVEDREGICLQQLRHTEEWQYNEWQYNGEWMDIDIDTGAGAFEKNQTYGELEDFGFGEVDIECKEGHIEVDWNSLVFQTPELEHKPVSIVGPSACSHRQDMILNYIGKYDTALLSGGNEKQPDASSDDSRSSDMSSVAPDGRFRYRSEADEAESAADAVSADEDSLTSHEKSESKEDIDTDTGEDAFEQNQTYGELEIDTGAGAFEKNQTYGELEIGNSSPNSQKSECEDRQHRQLGWHSFSATSELLNCRAASVASYMQATDAVIKKNRLQGRYTAAHGHSYNAEDTKALVIDRRLSKAKLQLIAARRSPRFVQQIVANIEQSQAYKYNKPG